ncbi:MAG: hypothetical protein V1833_07190 [Elusimicrobiota bacterium]
MNNNMKLLDNISEEKKDHFIEAQKSFQKIQEEIKPFIKQRKFKEHSTSGEWCETANILQTH